MEKIVILNDASEEDNILIACLRILFPQCEILVLSRCTETLGKLPVAKKSTTVDEVRKKNGHHPNHR